LVFSQRGQWQSSLDMALRIYPRVDRNVGSRHPMARHEVSEPAESVSVALPDDVRLYVDGEPSSALPSPTELHLVQLTKNGLWRSQMVSGEPVSQDWLNAPFRAPTTVRFWGNASVAVGVWGVGQWRGPNWPDDGGGMPYHPDGKRFAFWPGLVARGGLQIGRLGFVAAVDVGLVNFTRPIASYGQVGMVVELGWLKLGGGAGLGGGTYLEGHDDAPAGEELRYVTRTKALPYAMVTAIGQGGGFDGGLTVGYGPAVLLGSGYFGWIVERRRAGVPFRFGLSVSGQRGKFHPSNSDQLDLNSITWRAGVELGTGR
jgi:hypothetical protein